MFNSLITPAMNCSPLSEIILSSKLCNFQMLFLNNLASPFAIVFSVSGPFLLAYLLLSESNCILIPMVIS